MKQNKEAIAKKTLEKLTGKTNIIFQESCREATKNLVKKLKQENPGLKKLLLQEEGGWHTYPKLAAPNNLELTYLPMKNGKILLEELKKHNHSILIANSMPGYAYNEDMQQIQSTCKENNIILIDDASASIGTKKPVGNYIVCSLGEHKPISTGKGGFIATNNSLELKETIYSQEKYEAIITETKNLAKKLFHWKTLKQKLQEELISKGFKILNEETGINLLAEYNDEEERETLINFIKTKKYEYVECPKYIRTNKKALSIEIKRKKVI